MNNYTNSPFTNYIPSDLLSMFVGRDQQLNELQSMFRRGARAVALVGPPGTGKTFLAREFATQSHELFPGGTFTANASFAEQVDHLVTRVLPQSLDKQTLLIIEDAELLGQSGFAEVRNIIASTSALNLILTARDAIPPISSEFYRIYLKGFDREHFRELSEIRNAIAHRVLDEHIVERLFNLFGGNPGMARIAVEVVTNRVVPSWDSLFQFLRDFHYEGIVGPDGRPIPKDSDNRAQIILDVSAANAEIIELLGKNPEFSWKLPPRKFEEIVAELLNKQGYEITLTPASGDGGFDMYAAKKDGLGQFLYLVECKRYVPPNKVGVEIVRSLYGVLQAKKATAGAIVTTSYFTAGAESFRREIPHQMHLHDYLVLQQWLKKNQTSGNEAA